MPTWKDVVAAGTRFPGVEESTSYGTPSLKVRGKFMCRLRTNPDALVVRVIDVADQEALLKGDPDVFFITPHYDGWPGVLVRLEKVDPVQLAELVEDAWRTQAPKRLIKAHDEGQAGRPEGDLGESAGALSHRDLPRGLAEARARARGQWLHAPGGDVVRHLLAVQAQDVRNLPKALAARGGELRDGLIVTWLMRKTLHLVDVEDLEWLHPLFAPRMAARERRLRQLGVKDPDPRGANDRRHAAGDPRGDRRGARPHGSGRPAPDRARTAMQGHIAMTTEKVYVPIKLGKPPDRDRSLDELARRYYAAHACATRDDLAYWSGLPKRDCREPADAPVDDGPVPRRELPMFDELLLGWRDRSPTVPPELAKQVHPGGGMIRAVTVEDGIVTSCGGGTS